MTIGYISFRDARATQSAQLEAVIPRIAAQLMGLRERGRLRGPGPIFVGIGASFAAAGAPVWALRSRGIHSWRLGAGDLPVPFPASSHPIVGISQSGRSAETLAVLESTPQENRFVVVNNAPSPIAALTETVVELGNLRDSYASTIGYTATVAALGMLAELWNDGELDAGWANLHRALADAEAAVVSPVAELAGLFRHASFADFVGAGPAIGSAEAAALLFREVARIPSTGMSTRQYLHGSMESAGDGVHVVFGDGREVDLATTLARAGHEVILITSETPAPAASLHPVHVPRRPAAQRAILEILIMQSLVQVVADARGLEIEEFVFHNADTKVAIDAGESR